MPPALKSSAGYVEQDLQSKSQSARSVQFVRRLNKGMQILIMIGVVSMLALYAVIIVRCSKQPEW